jgi:hypothetical protein
MNLDELYQNIVRLGGPYKFFTEIDPSFTLEAQGFKARRWLNDHNKAKHTRFTSGGFVTSDAWIATALMVEPGVTPGMWAMALDVPVPQPEPEPEPIVPEPEVKQPRPRRR